MNKKNAFLSFFVVDVDVDTLIMSTCLVMFGLLYVELVTKVI